LLKSSNQGHEGARKALGSFLQFGTESQSGNGLTVSHISVIMDGNAPRSLNASVVNGPNTSIVVNGDLISVGNVPGGVKIRVTASYNKTCSAEVTVQSSTNYYLHFYSDCRAEFKRS